MSISRATWLAVASLVVIFAAPPTRADAPEAAKALASHTLDAKGVKIHYLLLGKGEPVLLLHGLHSSAEMNWGLNGVMAELAKDHTVIAPDLPGHGLSDKPDKDDAYGRAVIDDMVLLLDALKVKKAQVVGYSLGGMIAMKLVVMHPDRVTAVTLGGMGWLPEGSELQKIWEKMPAREGRGTPPAFIHCVGQFAVTEEQVRKIDAPVEVIVGDRDPVKRLYVDPLAQVRKDWPIVVIADAGHISCVMKPAFRDAITAWVRKNTK